ncbi:uncharacterized mitochondrial protein AtMg00810-like [Rutidosis leptorrhynchoides]|uniref:uncharacterized mitochondrial protein AtMg00810-like n=1 Tax=Rutidosis leptorrhynchoides TaxID=125765 RepID=UPI003A994049
MNDEMEALNRNNIWILTELPKDRKPIGSKWVYRIKYKSTGEIDRYKARLVAKALSIITGSSEAIIEECKVFFKSKFKIKDLGKLKYFLGLELVENDDFFVLCQRKYCLEVLAEFGVLASKPVVTPLESGVVFSNKDDFYGSDFLLENISEYHKLVGKLIYITLTRPNIA